MAANERIDQAWRAGSWPAGAFSIARFELKEEGEGTQLILDHLGFPQGLAEHLLEGWNSNYWQPFQKYLNGPANHSPNITLVLLT